MLGNYSFVIKALDPVNGTVQEGFKFVKPITIAMFYDVDKLVKANKKHVNNEVSKEDIDPVLYLWDLENETWYVHFHKLLTRFIQCQVICTQAFSLFFFL